MNIRYWRALSVCVILLGVACEETRLTSNDGVTTAADGRTSSADTADGTDTVDGTDTADGTGTAEGLDTADSSNTADGSDGVVSPTGADSSDGADLTDDSDSTDSSTDGVDGFDVVEQPPLDARTCVQEFTYDSFGADITTVSVAGEFNGWDTSANPLIDANGDGVFEGVLDTTGLAGSYGYKLVLDDTAWVYDPVNPMRMHVDGTENSKLLVEDCTLPSLELESLEHSNAGIKAIVAVRDGATESGIDADTAIVRYGTAQADGSIFVYDEKSQRFFVNMPEPGLGKHSFTFTISNGVGQAKPLHLPIWVEDEPFEWKDAVMYFAMTDRFRDAKPEVGGPVDCIPPNNANWQGGDWAGVTQKIEDGYFDALGVTALWLTAVVDNPDTCMAGSLGKIYTSYHGYFPLSQLSPENRLGSMDDLKALVNAAHARGIRVLVDLVANHLHSDHPLVSQKTPLNWFNDFFQCGFDEAPLTCWFEDYLPDLNYESDDAVEEMANAALWWVMEADLDGFRIDAVKHMHDNFLFTIREKINRELQRVPGTEFYTVGETFVGDWGGGTGPNETVLKKYINNTMLHGQFDFPMYWRILRVFARDEEPPSHVTDLLTQSAGYYGSKAVMSRFLGNHDVPRFISHAAGQIGDVWGNNSKQLGWDNPPGTPGSIEPYQRLMLAWSFLFTVEGIPLIYYGDEIGLPGAGDPDNRRMMVWGGWSSNNTMVYDHVSQLASVRRTIPALRRGTTEVLYTDDSVMAYRRAHTSGDAIVVINRGNTGISVPLGLSGSWTDALTESNFTGDVLVPGYGTLILTQ